MGRKPPSWDDSFCKVIVRKELALIQIQPLFFSRVGDYWGSLPDRDGDAADVDAARPVGLGGQVGIVGPGVDAASGGGFQGGVGTVEGFHFGLRLGLEA